MIVFLTFLFFNKDMNPNGSLQTASVFSETVEERALKIPIGAL